MQQNNVKLLDKVSTKSLLEQSNMLSVNQLNAQINLLEIWKSINLVGFPLKCKAYSGGSESSITRAQTNGKLVEPGTKDLTQKHA